MNRILSFEQEFIKKHPTRVAILRYMRAAIGTREVNWEDLTKINLSAVADHIKREVSPNSAVTYLAVLKGFISQYSEDVDMPCRNFNSVLKAKKVPQQNVALTEEELVKIESYYEKLIAKEGHQPEKDCLTLFLIECYCGARGCDTERLTENNIDGGRLEYVSKKTKVLASLPAHKRLEYLISRKPTQEYPSSTKNRVIKRVAEKCGIDQTVTIFYHGSMQTRPKYEFLGMHTARRTFASILAARNVPLMEISQYMSHSSVSMTERYVKFDSNNASKEAMSFFNRE